MLPAKYSWLGRSQKTAQEGRGPDPVHLQMLFPVAAVASCSGSAAPWPGPLPELLGLSHPPPCHVTASAPHHRFSPVCPGETACSTPAPRHQRGTHPRPRGSTRQDRSCSQALLSAATLAKGTPAHACVLTRRPCPSGCWSFVEGAPPCPTVCGARVFAAGLCPGAECLCV